MSTAKKGTEEILNENAGTEIENISEPADMYYEPAETSDEDLLNALLTTEDVATKQEYIPRFKAYFTVKSINSEEYNKLVERCKYPVKNKRTHQIEEKINQDKLSLLLIQAACVKPNWADKKLLEKYNTSDPCVVINKRLLIGEITQLSSAIMDISGFSDEIEKIKN